MHEIVELSPSITYRENNDTNERAPSFAIARQNEDARVRFAGIPMGHEFTSLVLALLQVSGYAPKIEPAQIEQIKNLDGQFVFETYISLSCQICPDVVQARNLLAILNPNIQHSMIDGGLQNKAKSLPNVTIITGAQTTAVIGDDKVKALNYKNRAGDEIHTLELEGIFVQIGLVPNTNWLKESVALTPRGEIEVDTRGQTNVPGVFAAGDATNSPFKQIIIAMSSGATSALGAFDYLIRTPVPTTSVASTA